MTRQEKAAAKRVWRALRVAPSATLYAIANASERGAAVRRSWIPWRAWSKATDPEAELVKVPPLVQMLRRLVVAPVQKAPRVPREGRRPGAGGKSGAR